MKNICFLIGNINHSGGTERVTSLIANALSEKDFHIHILSLWGGDSPFFPLNIKIKRNSLFSEHISMKKNYILTIWKIRKFIKNNNIQTLIVVDSISCIFTVPALFGLNNINHICWEHFNFNANLGVKLRDIGRKWAAKYCNYIITLTKRDKNLWENGLGVIRAKIVPITNPSPFKNIENTPSLQNKIVLTVGRLTDQKGFDLLIDAWKLVCKQRQDWKLYIVGSGENEIMLKQKSQNYSLNEFIEFIPATQNITQYYEKASLYCMSSRYEGLPMVLLEAQTYCLPIVSFNCDTGPSDIIEHEKNGLLVNCFDTQKLSESLLKMMSLNSKEYENYIKESRIRFKQFNIDTILKEWLKIL